MADKMLRTIVLLVLALSAAPQAGAVDSQVLKRIEGEVCWKVDSEAGVDLIVAELGDAGQKAFREIAAQRTQSAFLRACALHWLYRTPAEHQMVKKIARDETEPGVVRSFALVWFGVPVADEDAEVFAQALRSKDCDVVGTAWDSIAMLSSELLRSLARDQVTSVLASRSYPDGCVLRFVAAAGRLGARGAVPSLREIGLSASEHERSIVAEALCEIGGPEGLAASGEVYRAMTHAGMKELTHGRLAKCTTRLKERGENAEALKEFTDALAR